jgi:uncharacterized protein DUF5818
MMNRKIVVLLTLLALTVFALPFASAGTKGTWTGWITDDHCGSKGAKAEHQSCAERCLGRGSKLVFYNTADEKLYKLDNQDLAKQHLGHQVTVTGDIEGDSIKVESIAKAASGG